jgi:hypothetical protein
MSKAQGAHPQTFALSTGEHVTFYSSADAHQDPHFMQAVVQTCEDLNAASPLRTTEKMALVIEFDWSEWTPWQKIKQSTPKRNPLLSIPITPGVYQVGRVDVQDSGLLLYIGEGDNLDKRVRIELVKGDTGDTWHPKRKAILNDVGHDTTLLEVRWAATDFHIEFECLLVRQYLGRFGVRPKYLDKP